MSAIGLTPPRLQIERENETIEKNRSETTFFKIHCLQEKKIPKFNSKIRSIKIDIKSLPPSEHFLSTLKSLMKNIFECLIDNCELKDLMSLKIVTNNLEFEPSDKAFKPIGKHNHTQLEDLIQNMVQSKAFDVCDSFEIRATYVKTINQNVQCLSCEQCPACTVDPLNQIRCSDCLLDFNGQKCFDNHLKTLCNTRKKCPVCREIYDLTSRWRSHSCYCKVCKKYHINADHECYITPLPDYNSIDKCKFAFLFYDFETMQEKDVEPGKKLHEVNLCVAQLVCHKCFNSNLKKKCTFCENGKTYVFRNDPVKEFVSFVKNVKLPYRIKQLICIAHNSKNYDAQFILKHVVENLSIKPFLVVNGTSILFMSFDNSHKLKVKFIDSINYLDMKLAKLPETFGFENKYKKGYFPHFFNTSDNQDYKGPLPDETYYGIDDMNDKDLMEFQKWHKQLQEQNYIFDFKKEIVDYCLKDVNILRKACYAFRNMFIERANVDPFAEGATMASICMKIFKTKFLKSNTIGIIPNGGYRKQNRKRRLSIEWLLIAERDIDKEILHIGRGSEYRVSEDIVVDGYLQQEDGSRHVYQFYECLWHGCPKCFDDNRDEILKPFRDSHNARYEKTMSIRNAINQMGYNLTEMWECEFKRLKAENEKYLFDHSMLTSDSLNPRDGFFGGRIETYMAHRQISGDEKIHHIDICSLYPWVNKYGKVPIGHPDVYFADDCKTITGLDNDLSSVEGLVKCRILAPRDLYHPVLPMRINNRTMFSLCRLCCENSVKTDCRHDKIEDREFTGTWVSDELKKAVENGYRVTRIYEIWQYKVEQYDKETREGGIFTGYVDEFLQMKQSASGWPTDCKTVDDQEGFIEEYEKREGIRLIREDIVKNPGLRFISKRVMNTLWGKFGQGEYGTYEAMQSPSDLRDIVNCSSKQLEMVEFVDDKPVGYCKWMHKDEYIKSSADKNVVIAAYTTAQARLKLYTYLERLEDRVLYCNTDSCIYVSSPEKGQDEIETGNFLGDMTDELANEYGKGSYVREFVSCGSNLYSMIVVKPDGTENIVTKGVTINTSSKDNYSHENIKALAIGEKDIIRHSFRTIRQTKCHDVVTCEQKRTSKTSFLKRRFSNLDESYPFGYKKTKKCKLIK